MDIDVAVDVDDDVKLDDDGDVLLTSNCIVIELSFLSF